MSGYGDGTYGGGVYGDFRPPLGPPDPRAIDPVPCWMRHVVRGVEGDDSARPLGRVWFVREDVMRGEDGLNGRQGWQQGETTAVLSDDGSFSVVLPNGIGSDGILHKRRFACLTDPNYEPGEEWLEFWSDFDQERPFFVGTPTDSEKSRSAVTIKGADLNEVLAGSLSSEVDVWDANAPADVLGHYSRMETLMFGVDAGGAERDGTGGFEDYTWPIDDCEPDCWTAEADVRFPAEFAVGGSVNLIVFPGATLSVVPDVGDVGLVVDLGTELLQVQAKKKIPSPGSLSLRLVVRYERVFGFVNGELVAELRRPTPWPTPGTATVRVIGGVIEVDRLHAETLLPFAARGPSAHLQRNLPGLPPATGLRARYWSFEEVLQRGYTIANAQARTFPLGVDPSTERLEGQLDYPTLVLAPGMAGGFVARWSGAIYLDLAASDRHVRLTAVEGAARLYVGRTLRGDELVGDWFEGGPTTLSPDSALRDWLGTSESGWYPIVVELSSLNAQLTIVLEDAAVDDAGDPTEAYAAVPHARLSPIGCYEDHIRNTPHRTVIGDVAQTFGYQWRVQPRSLESGEFPGQYEFRSLVGRQTNLVVDDDQVGSEAVVQAAARDVVDGLLADAAGIADPAGSGQLSAQVIDFERAAGHMALRQAYESLADITEAPLLLTRIASLLALRSSPNEQVGVRPRGQVDLVDDFSLTGELAKMRWEPGDGVALDLDSVDVKDQSPRQMTAVSWSPRPDGIGVPTVSFRQRPRSPAAALKRLRAAIFGPRRTYQGSRATISGSAGGTIGAADEYSRLPLPTRLDDLSRVFAVVTSVGTGWSLEVDGIDTGPITATGRYDVTDVVTAAAAATLGQAHAYARLTGGTGDYLVTLEAIVRV